jgi:hypothetical protein
MKTPRVRTELVTTYAQLQERIRQMRRQMSGRLLVFRGQTRLRGVSLLPSLRRGEAADYLGQYDSIWDKVATRLLLAQLREYLRWEAANRPRRSPRKAAATGKQQHIRGTLQSHLREIFQHYGGRSQYLDVTTSVQVALWFAHHAFRMEEMPLLPPDASAIPTYDVAWYEPAWKAKRKAMGYVLVLAPGMPAEDGAGHSSRHGDFIDLLPNLFATRIARQKAGLVYSDKRVDSGDLRQFVRRIFRFALPLKGAPRFVMHTSTDRLFPPPNKDSMFRDLLASVPFREELDQPWSQRRVLSIPEYYRSFQEILGSRTWNAYRATDRYLPRNFLFEAVAPQGGPALEINIDGHTYSVRDALPILAPSYYSTVVIPSTEAECPLPEGRPNIFVEYDQMQTTLAEEEDKQEPQPVVGVWIVQSTRGYWCRVFILAEAGSDGAIDASPGHFFLLPRIRGDSLTQAMRSQDWESMEVRWLSVTLGLFAEVATGHRHLTPLNNHLYRVMSDSTRPGLSSRE